MAEGQAGEIEPVYLTLADALELHALIIGWLYRANPRHAPRFEPSLVPCLPCRRRRIPRERGCGRAQTLQP
jgi:hypothetical protein